MKTKFAKLNVERLNDRIAPAVYIWRGVGTDFNTGSNWIDDAATVHTNGPDSDDICILKNMTTNAPTLNASTTIAALTMDNTNVNNTDTLTLRSSLTIDAAGGSYTTSLQNGIIHAELQMRYNVSAGGTISNDKISVSGDIDLQTTDLVFAGTGTGTPIAGDSFWFLSYTGSSLDENPDAAFYTVSGMGSAVSTYQSGNKCWGFVF